MTSPLGAANAYASLARLSESSGGAAAGFAKTIGNAGAQDFGTMVKEALATVAQSGHSADLQMQNAAGGKADVVDIVTAVAESETAIETLVAVRDKVIQAYEEIMRMPI